MATHTDDQTANAVHDGVEGRTATHSTGGVARSTTPAGTATSAGSSHPRPNELVLESLTERAVVRIEVDGEITPDHLLAGSDTTAATDGIVISRIDGTGERAKFRFSGTMADLEIVEGDVTATVELHRGASTAGERATPLSIHAQGSEVDYEFAVTGTVEPRSGTVPDHGDGERPRGANGSVTGSGVDEYLVTGDVTEFETSTDDVLVMVGDQVVDAGDLG